MYKRNVVQSMTASWLTNQSIMATISATSAINIIMLLVTMRCQYGQAEQMANVQAHQVGTLNSIISVCYYTCLKHET